MMLEKKLVQKNNGFYKAADGTRIYYETVGEGQPLVLVYGIGCVMNHWHHQVEHFSKSRQVVLFDIRGHHKSTPVDDVSHLSMDYLASDLIGLMNHLGIKKADFMGHSFGVPYLLKTYASAPELFNSLIFINGFARNPMKKIFGFEFIEPLYAFLKQQSAKAPELWNSLWRTMIDNPLAFQIAALAGGFNIRLTQFKDIEVYGRGVSRLDLPIFFELFNQLLTYDGSDVLFDISVPTLVIAGEKDFITPPQFQKELADKIEGAQFEFIPYGSHCTQLDFPELVNYKVNDFLSSRNAR